MDIEKLMYGELAILPLVVGVIQAIKRFFPQAAGNVWFGLSLLLGVAAQLAIFTVAHPEPWDASVVLLAVVQGVAFGLASGKAYDKTLGE